MSADPAAAPLLRVEDLRVAFGGREVVHGISFEVARGETLAVVGESGSGKSASCLSLLRLLPRGAGAVGGRAMLEGRDLLALPDDELRRVRGGRVGMIFQEPMTSLNPVVTVGRQLTEGLAAHRGLGRAEAAARALDSLRLVRLPEPERRLAQYPHELSGGMRQRVMIAMAMALEPALLIADEPTTALDVTVQAGVLRLMRGLKERFGTGLVLVTHDMGVVAEMADRVLVLRHGRVVEQGPVAQVYGSPRADYTRELLAAVPRIDGPSPGDAPPAPPLLEARGLTKTFGGRGAGWFGRGTKGGGTRAVDGAGLELRAGETLALVGESGSGKSTLGRLIARLEDPDAGGGAVLRLDGEDLLAARGRRLRAARRTVQVVFQDPFASLNPRLTVGAAVTEPMAIHGLARGAEARRRAAALLGRVGLPESALRRYPHELSGGQRQRVAVARALAAGPRLIVADEPTSALDVSVQARVIELLGSLQAELGTAFLFISHDLAVVRRVAHRIAVMRRGRIVELGPASAVLACPRHPYTRDLLAAVPVPDPERARRRHAAVPPATPDYPAGALAEAAPGHWAAAA